MAMMSSQRTRGRARTVGVAIAAGVGLSLGVAVSASAAPLTPAVAASDVAAASRVASDGHTLSRLGVFFTHLDQVNATHRTGVVSPAQAAAKAPVVVGAAVPVYSLNPAFVAGRADASVARFAYVARQARSASGQTASVWVSRDAQGAWHLMNISSTVDEAVYPAQGAGDLVFTEPQINAWYRVHGSRVLPLNATARQAVGPQGEDLGAYQAGVHARYGDKLPGSAYAKAGKLGGYAPTSGNTTGGYGYAAPASVGLAGVALAAGGLLIRKRRRGESH